MTSKKKLSIKSFVFFLILEIIAIIMTLSMSSNIISPVLPFLVPFFLSVSLISNGYLVSLPEGNPNKFIRTFMLVTFLKFMSYIIVLVAYVMVNRDDAVRFMFCFLSLFLLYLVFDVIILLQTLPRKT
ncbi:MAG TPA: hypothetical protein PKW80_02595 [Bacteroidales bacterium]|nr:hypothetical protein [Bacteroidales bacterium]